MVEGMIAVKKRIIENTPITENDLVFRCWERKDIDLMSKWSLYPFPYETFNMKCKGMNEIERDEYYTTRENDKSRMTFVVDKGEMKAIGYYCFIEIDWDKLSSGNMGIRINPDCCNSGIGSWALKASVNLFMNAGFKSIRLDVAASNARAIRCYEKNGFIKTGEFFRPAEDLIDVEFSAEKYDFLRPFVKYIEGAPRLQFNWMEKTNIFPGKLPSLPKVEGRHEGNMK